MKRQLVLSAIAFGFGSAVLSCAPASAQTIIPTYNNWSYDDQDLTPPTFFTETWQAAFTGKVLVTDWAVVGDNYNIYDNGNLVASTDVADWTISDPTNSHYTSDANVAWADPLFAHASFGASAGDIITIESITVPSGYPDATVAISEAVPEASTWAMMVLGFAGLGYAGYRARRSAAALAA